MNPQYFQKPNSVSGASRGGVKAEPNKILRRALNYRNYDPQ
mgnify:CR=1 FL=1